MNLKEFVKETISETVSGMESAAELTGRRVRFSRGDDSINFDIAFVVEDTDSKQGGAGLNIKVVSLGGKMDSSSTATSTQRMKFSVEVGNRKRVEEEAEEAAERARVEEIRSRKHLNSAR
jgi:hypothetical protein